jgi:hypothetical protein
MCGKQKYIKLKISELSMNLFVICIYHVIGDKNPYFLLPIEKLGHI